MDAALLRPLGVMILALLRERDMHPYEMMRTFEARREDRLVSIRRGTLYHQVTALERDGLIAEVGVDREGNRPERTTYSLSSAGNAVVNEWIRAHLPRTDRPAEFRIALAEAHNLERDDVVALLSERLHGLRAQRDADHASLGAATAKGVQRQFLVEIDRARTLLDADIAWTTRLRDDISAGALIWGLPAYTDTTGKDRA